jgi:Ni,Fe-hydrogenase I cytochrome b subunit
MNASTPANHYLYQIEIRFWHLATTMMIHSRITQVLIRFGYNVLTGKPWTWLIAASSISAGIMFLLGYLFGRLIGW